MAVEDRIVINYDSGDTTSQIKKIEAAFKTQAAEIKNVTIQILEYNENMALLKATVSGIDAAGNKRIFQLGAEGDALTVVNSKLVANAKAANDAATAQNKLVQSQTKRQQALDLLDKTSKTVGINKTLPDATPGEVLAFQRAKDEYLRSLLAKGIGPGADIQKSAARIKGGEDPFELSGTGRDVGVPRQQQIRATQALLNYKQAYENLGKAARDAGAAEEARASKVTKRLDSQYNKETLKQEQESAKSAVALRNQRNKELLAEEQNQLKAEKSLAEQKNKALLAEETNRNTAAKSLSDQRNKALLSIQQTQQRFTERGTAESTLRNMFPAPSTASQGQLKTYESSIQRILGLIEKGKVDLATFNRLLAGGGAGGAGPPGSIGAAAGGPGDEGKVVANLNNIKGAFTDLKTKSDGILLSWQSIVRLFEVQVLHQFLTRLLVEFEQSIKKAQDYYIKIAEIETIQGAVKLSTDEWASSLDKLAGKYGFAQLDVASAAYETLSANVGKGKDALDFLNTSLEFARVTNSTAKESVDLLSSAINSFGLETKDARSVAEQFFKSIESGRVRTSEMANIFGRVGVGANLLGVKFNELNAAVTTLSVKGIKPAEVFTLLNNVFAKLTRPTEEMSALFDKWGVSSGEAAVKTFGFAEVLRRLGQEAKDGNVKVSELFNEIRSFRGGSGLLSSLADFEKNLNSPNNYNAAVLTTEQNNVQYLRAELEKLQVSFTAVGHSFNEYLVGGSKAVGGLSSAVESVASTFGLATKSAILFGLAFLPMRANIFLASQSISSLQGIYNRTTGALANFTAGLNANLNALAASPAAIAAVATAGYLVVDYLLKADERAKAARESFTALLEAQAGKYEKIVSESSPINVINGQIDIISQKMLASIAGVRVGVKAAYEDVKKLQLTSFENLKLTTSDFLDGLQDAVNNTKQRIREIESEIKRSIKTADDLQRKFTRDAFELKLQETLADNRTGNKNYDTRNNDVTEAQARLKFATQQLEELRKQRETVLNDKREPDKEKLGEIRAEYADIYEQLKQVASIQGKLNFNTGLGNAVTKMRELIVESRTLETEYQKALAADEKRQKVKLAEEEKRLRLAKDIIKQILELEGLGDPSSKINDKFKKPADGLKNLLDLSKQLFDLSGKSGIGFDRQLQLGLQLTDTYNKVRDGIRLGKGGALGKLDEEENNINNQAEAWKKQAKAADEARDAALKAIDVNKIKATNLAEELKDKLPGRFGRLFADRDVDIATGQIKKNLENISGETGKIDQKTSPETIQNLIFQLVNARTQFQNIVSKDAKFFNADEVKEQLQKYAELETRLRNLSIAQRQFNNANTDLNNFQQKLDKQINPDLTGRLPVRFNNVGAAGAGAAGQAKEGFEILNKTLRQTNDELLTIQRNLLLINKEKAEEAGKGGGKAFGGLIGGGFDPGNISDNVMTPTSKGEYVINSTATARFYPQIAAMNNGIDPWKSKSASQSGSAQSSPTVHLNVILQPKSLSQDDIREVGSRLRREIQRGTVSLT